LSKQDIKKLFTFNHDPEAQQPNLYDKITTQCVLAYLGLDWKNGDEVDTKLVDEKTYVEGRQEQLLRLIETHNFEKIDEEILEKVKDLLNSEAFNL
jgi:hypothetical protein